jgi:hypothetical protein
MSNKQTAVEWLISELTEYNLMNKDILPSHPIFNKAKELEKQQIIDSLHYFGIENAQDYYNETYGGQDNE